MIPLIPSPGRPNTVSTPKILKRFDENIGAVVAIISFVTPLHAKEQDA
jgi:hypothetical protein